MLAAQGTEYRCIFCGHKSPAEKQFWADKLENAELNLPSPDGTGYGGAVSMKSHPKPKTYYSCSGCSIDYEDISDFEVINILHGLKVKEWVVDNVRDFYDGKVGLEELIRNHRTGIGKRARHGDSFLNTIISKRKIIIGIKFEGIRCFLSLVKVGRKGKQHYEIVDVGRP
jgi:DNA-directed RNA polymerase subunit RPC12/RpoP